MLTFGDVDSMVARHLSLVNSDKKFSLLYGRLVEEIEKSRNEFLVNRNNSELLFKKERITIAVSQLFGDLGEEIYHHYKQLLITRSMSDAKLIHPCSGCPPV